MKTHPILGSIPLVMVLMAGIAGSDSAAAFTANGPIVDSTLGERLRGTLRIDLQPGELPPESVEIAPDEIYRKMGLRPPETGASLYQIRLRQRSELSWDVVIESQASIREPIVALVLAFRQGATTHYRDVTMMIDPPGMPSLNAGAALAPAANDLIGSAARSAAPIAPRTHRVSHPDASGTSAPVATGPSVTTLSHRSSASRAPALESSASLGPASRSFAISHFRMEASLHTLQAPLAQAAPLVGAAVPASAHTAAPLADEASPRITLPEQTPAAPAPVAAVQPAPAVVAQPPAAPTTVSAAGSGAQSKRPLLARSIAAFILLISGLVVWMTRRDGASPVPPLTLEDALAPPMIQKPAKADSPIRGPGRVTPIESAYAIRGAQPPAQRVVGE